MAIPPSGGESATLAGQTSPESRAGAGITFRNEEDQMGKTGRKRRSRRKNKANHGKRPNA